MGGGWAWRLVWCHCRWQYVSLKWMFLKWLPPRRSFASGMYITTRKPDCHALGLHTATPKQQQTLSRMDWPVAHWSQAWWPLPRTEVTAHFSPSRMPFLSSPAQQLSVPWPEGSFNLDCTHLHYQEQNHRFFCWWGHQMASFCCLRSWYPKSLPCLGLRVYPQPRGLPTTCQSRHFINRKISRKWTGTDE